MGLSKELFEKTRNETCTCSCYEEEEYISYYTYMNLI